MGGATAVRGLQNWSSKNYSSVCVRIEEEEEIEF